VEHCRAPHPAGPFLGKNATGAVSVRLEGYIFL